MRGQENEALAGKRQGENKRVVGSEKGGERQREQWGGKTLLPPRHVQLWWAIMTRLILFVSLWLSTIQVQLLAMPIACFKGTVLGICHSVVPQPSKIGSIQQVMGTTSEGQGNLQTCTGLVRFRKRLRASADDGRWGCCRALFIPPLCFQNKPEWQRLSQAA